MAARIKEEEASAPFWLLTLGDMNNLLMCFFIALIAFMTTDKNKANKLQDDLESIASSGHITAKAGQDPGMGLRTLLDQDKAQLTMLRLEGSYVSVQKIQEGTIFTIGGAEGSFEEGRWTLNEKQRHLIREVKRGMAGRRNLVEVRGHASANLADSVVIEPGGRPRPFTPEDLQREDRDGAANHSMLSALRAEEVRKALVIKEEKFPEIPPVKELQVRTRAEGYTRNVRDPVNTAQNRENRRIEIVLTSELLEK